MLSESSSHPSLSIPWKLYALMGLVLLLLLLAVLYSLHTGRNMTERFAKQIDAAMEIKLEATTAHLWFEELMAGDAYADIDEVMAGLDRSMGYTRALLSGGERPEGTYLPVRDSELRRMLRKVLELQTEFKAIATERWDKRERRGSGIGTPVDQRFDAVFVEFIETADAVEDQLLSVVDRELQRFRLTQWGIIGAILALALMTLAMLHRFARNRNRALAALREQEIDLRITLSSIGDAVISTDIGGLISKMNPVAEELTGWSEQEARKQRIEDVFVISSARTGERVPSPVEKVLRLGRVVGLANHTTLTARDGTERQIADSGSPIRDEQGEIRGAVLVFRDVTEEHALWSRLRQSEEQHRTLYNSIRDAILVADAERRIEHCNQAFSELFGYSLEEIRGRETLTIYASRDDFEELGLKIREAGGDPDFTMTVNYISKSGRVFPGETNVCPLKNGQGRTIGFIGLIRDVSEQRRVEEERERIEAQLRQAQKMEAVGRLAGGVAHDFNNMLNVILGYTDIVLARVGQDDQLFDQLSQIRRAAERSAELTRQLLAFSRKQPSIPQTVNMNRLISEHTRMLERLIGEHIDLELLPADDLWNIRIDPSQVDQILANLAVNARDAIGGTGRISIETANVVLDETYSREHLYVTPGEYVLLSFSDSGSGMDAEMLEHIFEPFFTTKSGGKGTGLGLATVYGIVKQNRGVVHVYSEPGLGTTFKIYFPRVVGTDERPETKKETADLSGQETIMVVEDEEQVLSLAETILTQLGYTVLTARRPSQALALAQEHPGEIQLLLTDVVMPEMNGKQLKERLEAIHPDPKVLYMSGYTDNVIARHGMIEPGLSFIQKPFSIQALSEKVREVLDS